MIFLQFFQEKIAVFEQEFPRKQKPTTGKDAGPRERQKNEKSNFADRCILRDCDDLFLLLLLVPC